MELGKNEIGSDVHYCTDARGQNVRGMMCHTWARVAEQ